MINFKKLKDIREDHDINQESMAKILKVNRSTYSLWELGINIIPLKYLCCYADYFNLTIDYILSLTNDKSIDIVYKGFDKKNCGERMKAIRLEDNLSQENVADILKVSQACIAKYEICGNLINAI